MLVTNLILYYSKKWISSRSTVFKQFEIKLHNYNTDFILYLTCRMGHCALYGACYILLLHLYITKTSQVINNCACTMLLVRQIKRVIILKECHSTRDCALVPSSWWYYKGSLWSFWRWMTWTDIPPSPSDSGVDLVPLIVTLNMVGKFCMTAAFGTVVLYAPEIYPTNLRNFGFGMASVWGRIGAMIAPFSAYVVSVIAGW